MNTNISFTVGRFQPLTQGHLNMCLDANEPIIIYRINSSDKPGPIKIKGKLAKKSQIQHALDYVDSNCETKLTEDEKEILKRPFTNDLIEKELDIVKKNNKNIVDVIYVKNVFDALDRFNKFCSDHPEYTPHYMMCGDDRVKNYQDMLDKLGKYDELETELGSKELIPNVIAGKIETNIGTGRQDGLSGTAVRECIIKKDKAMFEQQMPAGVGVMFDEFTEAFDKFIEKLREEVKEAKEYMSLEEYIAEHNIHIEGPDFSKNIVESMKCRNMFEGIMYDNIVNMINHSNMYIFEKFALFNGCDKIADDICNFLKQEVADDINKTGSKNLHHTYDIYKADNSVKQFIFFDKLDIYLDDKVSDRTKLKATIDLSKLRIKVNNTFVTSGVKLNIHCADDLLGSGILSSLIQHELTHLYNAYCELLSFNSDYIKGLSKEYANMLSDFTSNKYDEETLEHQIEETIYFLEKSEVNAYTSQLHSEVKQLVKQYPNDSDSKSENIVEYIFKHSQTYNNYLAIFILTDYLKSEECANEFKKEYAGVFNNLCNTDYPTDKVIKIVLNRAYKAENKIKSMFPKIVYDYVKESAPKHTITYL